MDKPADVLVEVPLRQGDDPEQNPYRVGPAAVGSRDDQIEAQPKLVPRTDRIIRLVGVTNLFAAAFLILLVVGSLWFLSRLGFQWIARNAGNRPFQIWVIERGLALPLLIALQLWLARGLARMQGRAIVVQTILSAVVALWALILTLDDFMMFSMALDEVDVAPAGALMDIAYYLTKFVSGFGHAAIALLFFRFIRAERRDVAANPKSETTNGLESAR